ncbi:MAG: hypothetical protein ACRDUA_03400 [Micromonosporaceae bacterium]
MSNQETTVRRWRHWAAMLALALTAGLMGLGTGQGQAEAAATANDDVTITAGCDNHPGVPDWFYPVLRRAAAQQGDGVPSGWGTNLDQRRAMMKIICNESSFNTSAHNPAGYYGLGQMGRPAISDARVRFACYWYVNNDCAHNRRYVQSLAALRYANQRYNGPIRAWNFWKNNHWW